jgi:hypothetical protein
MIVPEDENQVVKTAIEQLEYQLENLINEKNRKNRSPQARNFAVAITDLEKVMAYLKTYCLKDDWLGEDVHG